MYLARLLDQYPQLHALLQAPSLTETELQRLEDTVRAGLENVATYRLVSATAAQMQTYLLLLDAYAQDMSQLPEVTRRQLATKALLMFRVLAHAPDKD